MKRNLNHKKTQIICNETYEAESLEEKLRRMIETGEDVGETVTCTYTERKDGVLPEYDIRTDRFDLAVAATDKVSATLQSQREERIKAKEKKVETPVIDENGNIS